jgi:hypothetical protein
VLRTDCALETRWEGQNGALHAGHQFFHAIMPSSPRFAGDGHPCGLLVLCLGVTYKPSRRDPNAEEETARRGGLFLGQYLADNVEALLVKLPHICFIYTQTYMHDAALLSKPRLYGGKIGKSGALSACKNIVAEALLTYIGRRAKRRASV